MISHRGPRAKAASPRRKARIYLCPQLSCLAAFRRTFERDRHAATAHQLFSDKVYLCAIPDCPAAERPQPRKDKFRLHVRREHPDEDPEELIRRSTVAATEPSVLQGMMQSAAGRRTTRTPLRLGLPPRPRVKQEEQSDAASIISTDHAASSTKGGQRYRRLRSKSRCLIRDGGRNSVCETFGAATASPAHSSCTHNSSIRMGTDVQSDEDETDHGELTSVKRSRLMTLRPRSCLNHGDEVVVESTEAPGIQCAPYNSTTTHHAVGFNSSYQASGSRGSAQQHGQGKLPVDGSKDGHDEDRERSQSQFPSGKKPSKSSANGKWPCIWRGAGRRGELNTCWIKKTNLSHLNPHFGLHEFQPCDKCLGNFVSKEDLGAHRIRRNVFGNAECVYRCVTEGCDNFRQLPVYPNPCLHGDGTSGNGDRVRSCATAGCHNHGLPPLYQNVCCRGHDFKNSGRSVWREYFFLERGFHAPASLPFPIAGSFGSPSVVSPSPAPSFGRRSDGPSNHPAVQSGGPQHSGLRTSSIADPYIGQFETLRLLTIDVCHLAMQPEPSWTEEERSRLAQAARTRPAVSESPEDVQAMRIQRLWRLLDECRDILNFPRIRTRATWAAFMAQFIRDFIDEGSLGVLVVPDDMPWIAQQGNIARPDPQVLPDAQLPFANIPEAVQRADFHHLNPQVLADPLLPLGTTPQIMVQDFDALQDLASDFGLQHNQELDQQIVDRPLPLDLPIPDVNMDASSTDDGRHFNGSADTFQDLWQ